MICLRFVAFIYSTVGDFVDARLLRLKLCIGQKFRQVTPPTNVKISGDH
jgi:hypothetical protein